MKKLYIIEVDESDIVKCWNEQAAKELGYQEYALKKCPEIKVKPYNPSGDLISRSALKDKCNELMKFNPTTDRILNLIDNASTVNIEDQIAGAYNEGYMCGNKEAEKARLHGEYVDISKLRLMTVEECAGHTIDYAMGWKACAEWIKKGGAE